MSYVGFTKWIQVQLENVISEVFPAWVELASDEPDAVWAETLVVDTELDSLGPAHTSGSTTRQNTQNYSRYCKHLDLGLGWSAIWKLLYSPLGNRK